MNCSNDKCALERMKSIRSRGGEFCVSSFQPRFSVQFTKLLSFCTAVCVMFIRSMIELHSYQSFFFMSRWACFKFSVAPKNQDQPPWRIWLHIVQSSLCPRDIRINDFWLHFCKITRIKVKSQSKKGFLEQPSQLRFNVPSNVSGIRRKVLWVVRNDEVSVLKVNSPVRAFAVRAKPNDTSCPRLSNGLLRKLFLANANKIVLQRLNDPVEKRLIIMEFIDERVFT